MEVKLSNESSAVTGYKACKSITHISRTAPIIINKFRPRQNGPHFADDILKCIFLNKKIWILIKIFIWFCSQEYK